MLLSLLKKHKDNFNIILNQTLIIVEEGNPIRVEEKTKSSEQENRKLENIEIKLIFKNEKTKK